MPNDRLDVIIQKTFCCTILNKSKTNFLKKEAILVAVIFAKIFCRVDLKLSQISQVSVMLVDVLDKHSGTGLFVSELGLS